MEHKELQMLCVVVCSLTHKDSEKTYLAKPQWRIVTLASALKTATWQIYLPRDLSVALRDATIATNQPASQPASQAVGEQEEEENSQW